MTALRQIVGEADIAAADGARVEVLGTYTAIDLSRRPRAIHPSAFIAIQLADGERVLLEPPWHPAARRSPAERAAHLGQQVRVVGMLHATVPEQFEGAATPRMPCLVDIESLTKH